MPSLKVATMKVSFIVTKTQVDLRASKITYWIKTINNCLFFSHFYKLKMVEDWLFHMVHPNTLNNMNENLNYKSMTNIIILL